MGYIMNFIIKAVLYSNQSKIFQINIIVTKNIRDLKVYIKL